MTEQELDTIESTIRQRLETFRDNFPIEFDNDITGVWEMTRILTNCIRANLTGQPVLTYTFRYEEENCKKTKKG